MSTAVDPGTSGGVAGAEAPLLSAENVTMRFGGLTAVSDVAMEVFPREIVGLIGPNGAGKTTFFNCLTGLYKPTSGRVVLDGRQLTSSPRKVVEAGMARTFQNIRLFQNMTALENVMVGRYCRTRTGAISAITRAFGFKAEEAATRAKSQELLEFVGLGDSAEHLARNLPYGDQRRLEIARALATEPKVLLLDEPTAGMNPQETRQAEELIFKIRDTGLAVVVIEHDMRFIFNLCDRVLCLVRGKVLVEGTPEEVQSDPRVIEAYIGTSAEAEADLAGDDPTPQRVSDPTPQRVSDPTPQRFSDRPTEGSERDGDA
ncbi:branched-chain amino acid transport system ATP-binding protein [Naumannella cuiyingiana]|uniref:Branched-chain amino acid transport system ATP-binding protein n=1 Tax=Naumannella cuiyingiana TaxID=1347891 RepID=A0A7Z0DAT7_9ACTN|nr:ABC transporter ATP-binding protein [Naumannella cuiyingiana]NYI72116.1 branched-chain amino acid transport system ATP-binding protein [Naumannella cuiyingiana]